MCNEQTTEARLGLVEISPYRHTGVRVLSYNGLSLYQTAGEGEWYKKEMVEKLSWKEFFVHDKKNWDQKVAMMRKG